MQKCVSTLVLCATPLRTLMIGGRCACRRYLPLYGLPRDPQAVSSMDHHRAFHHRPYSGKLKNGYI